MVADAGLTIYGRIFDEIRKAGEEEAKATFDEEFFEDSKPIEVFGVFDVDVIDYEDGVLNIIGEYCVSGKTLFTLSINIDIGFDLAIEIIKDYVARFNKVKTVLEAVKPKSK